MLIKNQFEVAQPVDKVWEFFGDIPQVAACLPGAELTERPRRRRRTPARVGDPDGAGQAAVRRQGQDPRARRRRPSGWSSTRPAPTQKGRGQAAMTGHRARSPPAGRGTKVDLDQDLQLSGAAAQYGRGMISDVTTVLMGAVRDEHAAADRAPLERGESLDGVGAPSASGFAIGLQAVRLALMRVFRRFFLPYHPTSPS